MRLFLMRHASAEINHQKDDIARILTQDGEKEAEKAAEFLQSNHHIDKLISSHSKRTIQTAETIANKVKIDEVEVLDNIYQASENQLIEIITDQTNTIQNLLVIGHNPVIFNLAARISNADSKLHDALMISAMPPARIVIIDFKNISEWSEIVNHQGEILNIFTSQLP